MVNSKTVMFAAQPPNVEKTMSGEIQHILVEARLALRYLIELTSSCPCECCVSRGRSCRPRCHQQGCCHTVRRTSFTSPIEPTNSWIMHSDPPICTRQSPTHAIRQRTVLHTNLAEQRGMLLDNVNAALLRTAEVMICSIALNSYRMLKYPYLSKTIVTELLSTAANVVHIVRSHDRFTEHFSKTMPSFIMRYHSVLIENSTLLNGWHVRSERHFTCVDI